MGIDFMALMTSNGASRAKIHCFTGLTGKFTSCVNAFRFTVNGNGNYAKYGYGLR